VSEWLQVLIDWGRKEKGDEESIAQGLLQSFEMTAKREQDLSYTCNTGHVQEKEKNQENLGKNEGGSTNEMTGKHVIRGWDKQRRKERGERKLMPLWTLGKKKGKMDNQLWTQRAKFDESYCTLSIFNLNFNLVFFCLCFFLLVILLWILWINTHFISVVSYPFPAESTFNEWFQNIAWKLRTLWKEGGMTWVRLIFNKEILTQQYIFFVVNLKPLYQRSWRGKIEMIKVFYGWKFDEWDEKTKKNPISFPFQKNIYVKKIPNEKILGKVTKNFGTVYNVCSV